MTTIAAAPAPDSSLALPSLHRARRVADAVLYEGYVLFPYRASSRKNRYRFTFGVLVPRAWSERDGTERASLRVECLVERAASAAACRVEGLLRFLQVERRVVEEALPGGGFRPVEALEVDGHRHVTWEEATEREIPFSFDLADDFASGGRALIETSVDGGRSEDALLSGDGRIAGRVVRTRLPLDLAVNASAARIDVDPEGHPAGAPAPQPLSKPLWKPLWKITIRVDNVTPIEDPSAPREQAVAASLVGAHLLLSVSGGGFLSLLDPPAWARDAASGCQNVGAYPVLAGEPGRRDVVLASPIVLYDHPEIAAESPGHSYDGTEVDELIALSTRSLTDEEKREARATDPRAAGVIDRAENLSSQALLALHGRGRTRPSGAPTPGARVRIRIGNPATGARRTDAQDMFLDGRIGVVEEVLEDFEGRTYFAVLLEDDPVTAIAGDDRWHIRHLHFHPEEVELVEAAR